MKIAFDYKIFWNQRYGGISRYFTNLIYNLENKSYSYKVFAPFYRNKYLKELPQKRINGKFTKDDLPFTSNITKIYNDFVCPYKMNLWKPDITHYTYYYQKIKKKNKTLITVYDLIHEKISNQKNIIIKPKEEMISIADHIICISDSTKKDLQKFYNVEDSKISVIYLGSDHFDYDEKKIEKNETHFKPYILYVGSRAKYKNFDFFIKSFSKSKKLKENFNIVLFGGENISIEEKNLFKNLGISNDSVNHITGEEGILNNLYRNAKVFVFPSLFEGFGLPIIESLKNNCPVVCSNIPVFNEIGGNLVDYFEPDNIESLIFTLEKKLFSSNDENLQKKYSKIILDKFNWEKCSEQTIDVYKKISS